MAAKLVCGLDEAGRGPLAGPVVAAAVILPSSFPLELLGDSKKLSLKKRLAARQEILRFCCWGVGVVEHTVIDELNILNASLLAMERAFFQMEEKIGLFVQRELGGSPDVVVEAIADGTFVPGIGVPCRAVPKADATFAEVMAASILAKTQRDMIMEDYARLYPEYGYERHKGYPTKAHRETCRRLGPSPIQRMSFKY